MSIYEYTVHRSKKYSGMSFTKLKTLENDDKSPIKCEHDRNYDVFMSPVRLEQLGQ